MLYKTCPGDQEAVCFMEAGSPARTTMMFIEQEPTGQTGSNRSKDCTEAIQRVWKMRFRYQVLATLVIDSY